VAWNLDIGYEQFTRLCQALARDILGPSVRLLNSPRSPWDAEFDTGTGYWRPTTEEEQGGLGVLDVKYLHDPGRRRRESPDRTLGQWYRQAIRSDLEKIQRQADDSPDSRIPEGFILATNASLSDLTEKARDEASGLLAEYETKFGDLRFEVWDREFISRYIDSLPDARYGFILGHDYILRSYEPVDIGRLTRYQLTSLGDRPTDCPEVIPAWWRLVSVHDSVGGLFDTLYSVRRLGADGGSADLPDSSQDLLRAAIVFSSAGLDACLEVLISHAVPILVSGNDKSRRKFERYIDSQATAPKASQEFLSAIKDPDPRARLLELYIRDLTTASFQGSASIKDRCSTALGITNEQLPGFRLTSLDEFFRSRNDVAHRLDLTKPGMLDAKPDRQPRSQEEVGRMCDEVLVLVRDLIRETASNVSICR
jgi:hypothetical protein